MGQPQAMHGTPHLTAEEILSRKSTRRVAYAMFSSDWNGITSDPRYMRIPIDDHLVHRGDGVFETLLCVDNALYNLSAHIDRLFRSAEAIGLGLPWTKELLRQIVLDTFHAAGKSQCLGRILLGRGTGGFGVSPAECEQASCYIVVYPGGKGFMESHPLGARIMISSIPVKSGGLARIKTCNYLPNALMKAEALQAGVDFAVSVDPEGYLAESFTENIALVRERTLHVAPATHHLAGTTLARVVELAKASGYSIDPTPFTATEALAADEVLIVGTTAYVTSVVAIDERPVGSGAPGPVASELDTLLREDIKRNTILRDSFIAD